MTRYFPDFETFSQLAREHTWIPVYRRLLDDTLTPVSAFHKIDAGSSACLFESVVRGEKVGRYSFLAADPFLEIEATGPTTRVTRDGRCEEFACDDPLEELRRRVAEIRVATLAELPPFTGGAVGYAGYDVVRYCEHLPNAPENDRNLPDLAFAFYDHMIVFDHVQKTIVVVAMARIDEPGADAASAYRRAQERIDQLVAQLQSPGGAVSADAPGEKPHAESAAAKGALAEIGSPENARASGSPGVSITPLELTDIDSCSPATLDYTSNFSREAFKNAVRRCVEYIRAGDIFQVVISQRLELPLRSHPFEIYRTLRVVNPSPFMFYLRTPRVTLVGSSPEVMVRVVGGRITVRPLAGTRRRGATEQEDRRLAAELLADPKERAEHVMLVDLGRNDVGRVARYRSVELTDVMTIERYSHVMHITSNVTGQLAEGRDAFDALRACLPAGTVSGAPKVRAMEIIDEIEPHRRGPYAGAVGYVDFNGNMDTCIALRTLVAPAAPRSGGAEASGEPMCYIQAGAGIVADSVPSEEYQETLNKARGLLTAIAITDERSGVTTPIAPSAASTTAMAAADKPRKPAKKS